MAADTPEPLEGFETWLLRRVAQAVEAGEVPAALVHVNDSLIARSKP